MKIRFVVIGLVLAALILLTLGLSGVIDTPFRLFKSATEKSPGKTELAQSKAPQTKSEKETKSTSPKLSMESAKIQPIPDVTAKPQGETGPLKIGQLDHIIDADTPIDVRPKADKKPVSEPAKEAGEPAKEAEVSKDLDLKSAVKSPEFVKTDDKTEQKKIKREEAENVLTLREILKQSGVQDLPTGKYFIHTVRPRENMWNIIRSYLIRKYAESGIKIGRRDDEILPNRKSSPFGLEIFLKERRVYLYNFRNKNLSQDINLLYSHQQVVILKDLLYEDLLLLSK